MNSQHASLGNCALSTLLWLVVSVFTVTAQAIAQCQYDVTIIQAPECPPFGFPPTIGLGLSEQGHVVGTHLDCEFIDDEAFVWTPETGLVTLPFPPATIRKVAFDIDGGLIVGRFDILGDGLADLAFMHDGQEVVNLGTLPGHNWSEAYAISQQQGRIVGFSMNNATSRPLQAVIWDENGEITNIGEVLLPPNSVAYDISDMTGEVTGWMGSAPHIDAHAFIWAEGGVVTDLGPVPPDGFSSAANAINGRSEVTGGGILPDPDGAGTVTRAFLWSQGRMINLGTLPGFPRSSGFDISNNATIVGQCWGAGQTGYIWRAGVMTDLNDLIDPDSGVYLFSARAINEAGEILARGTVEGNAVSVLLTPTAAPIGDLDGDCRVSIFDLLSLLAAWGPCDECSADLDEDGYVGIGDLLILLGNWG